MTFFRKFLPKILVSILVIAFLIISPFSLFGKIDSLNYNINKEYKFDFSGVLTLWNVDTFEGGTKSRAGFLENRALEFEKQNKGVYINIQNLSPQELELNLNSGKKPNMITFGIGVGEKIFDNLINFSSSFGVRDDLIQSAKQNNELKAIPIMLGGYTLISNKELISGKNILESLKTSKNPNLIFSSKDYNNPLLALFVNDLMLEKQEVLNLDSFDAYDKFINQKFCAMLGTQRDFYRCKNRENNNKMQCEYNLLGGFSDLIVYASIFSSFEKAESVCKNFVEYLTCEYSQQKLEQIGMFSVLNNIKSTDEDYKLFGETLQKKLKTVNVFYSNQTLNEIKTLVTDYVVNNKLENKKEILKYING